MYTVLNPDSGKVDHHSFICLEIIVYIISWDLLAWTRPLHKDVKEVYTKKNSFEIET